MEPGTPRVTLIAALSEDGYISMGTGVPWDLPEDREHFRKYCAGKWLLAGRVTYEEMTGWFHDHTPLVLTRNPGYQPPVGRTIGSVEQAIHWAGTAGQAELVVIGGGQTYAAAMPHANSLIITHVEMKLGRGIRFPFIDPLAWIASMRDAISSPPECRIPYKILRWERRGAVSPF